MWRFKRIRIYDGTGNEERLLALGGGVRVAFFVYAEGFLWNPFGVVYWSDVFGGRYHILVQ